MTTIRSLAFLAALAVFALCGVEVVGNAVPVPGFTSLVSPAQAIIGRPLTPVSVAGVARRTTRRCVAGVYYC